MDVSTIAYVVVTVLLLIALDSINDRWKYWFFLLAVGVAILFLRVAEHNEGYNDGFSNGACDVARSIDATEHVIIKNLEDYCK